MRLISVVYLIQLLLPIYDNSGRRFPRSKMHAVNCFLTRQFGGLTIYKHPPVEGLCKESASVVKDDIVIFGVMADRLQKTRWTQYRHQLEMQFWQERIIVRASKMELL